MSEILKKENIYLNCELEDKEAVIRRIGEIFVRDGYATDQYSRAMLEKEKVFNTAIGSSLAIPHGIESMKDQVLQSGLVVMTFPQGLAWGEQETVKLVIGIAARGDEHIDILSNIATHCASEEETEKIICSSREEIYEFFAGV